MMHQQTLLSPVQFEGVGIHSGLPCTITMYPAPENFGICFKRLDTGDIVPASPHFLAHTLRATALEKNGISIKTPEHILAALAGLNIHNVLIETSNEEIPIMDGSSLLFTQKIKDTGLRVQPQTLTRLQIDTPLILKDGDATLIALPSEHPSFTYHLELKETWIGSQTVHFQPGKHSFEKDIAPARTFGFTHEIEFLKKNGLARGGSLENALVLGDTDYLNPVRFPDELARHKLLDLMGDCWVLGRPINAHIIGIKSGHALTMQLVKTLFTNSSTKTVI